MDEKIDFRISERQSCEDTITTQKAYLKRSGQTLRTLASALLCDLGTVQVEPKSDVICVAGESELRFDEESFLRLFKDICGDLQVLRREEKTLEELTRK